MKRKLTRPNTEWRTRNRHAVCVRGLNSAKGPDSSINKLPNCNCLDVDHMEEEVQVRVQVEVEREEQGIGETHGKEQGEEQRVKEHSNARHE